MRQPLEPDLFCKSGGDARLTHHKGHDDMNEPTFRTGYFHFVPRHRVDAYVSAAWTMTSESGGWCIMEWECCGRPVAPRSVAMTSVRNMSIGLCEIADGLVSIFSLGFYHARLAFRATIWWELRELARLKRASEIGART
jgi:hypothetical protein